ncbi:MAG: hypothetical protein JW741_18420 [Sedimentisphaerales bacterium]|nr:hypothetical protein [Sedimentisphaerales bacterium]
MSVRVKWALLIAVLFVTVIVGALCSKARRNPPEASSPPTHAEIAGPAIVKARAEYLEATIVTPHLDCEITGEKNILWCASFQLAWNELCDLLGGPVQSSAAPEKARILNEQRVTRDDLDENSYVALAGYPTGKRDDIFRRIETELKCKFGAAAAPAALPNRASLRPTDWVAYAYLFKDLPFEWAFRREGGSFADRRIETFGLTQLNSKNEAKMASQVRLYDCKDEDDFIMELQTLSKSDRLILAKTEPASTLAATIRAVQQRLARNQPERLPPFANLAIPVLDFDISRRYSELAEEGIAMQLIRFRLDERGAVLKSEAIVRNAIVDFIFNKPFLVMLQRIDAKQPYFALWVANAELLSPFSRF